MEKETEQKKCKKGKHEKITIESFFIWEVINFFQTAKRKYDQLIRARWSIISLFMCLAWV